MRDLVYLRRHTKALLKQLRPTGRAWQYPDDSDSAREQDVKSESLAAYLFEVERFVAEILPDNDLFDEQAAIDWERRLGLDYDPTTLTLEERRAEITRKLSYPGGYKYTLTLEFIEYQLRASLFDVRVYRNPNQSQPAGTELIANSVDKEDGFVIDNYYHSFIIAGADINTEAIIKTERRQEFIRKVLKYKPMNMVCFLLSTISKQDGTFKLYYDTYTCERIEETPPYATNVRIVGGFPEVGQTLTGAYDYNDDQGDPESGTLLQWYRADDASGTNAQPIAGADEISYTLQAADGNKFIAFGVTPANTKSFGSETLSNYVEIEAQIVPVITQFEGGNDNILIWTMADGTQSTGTWQVDFAESPSGPWTQSTSGGSPRKPVLPVGVYNKTMYFRVKRVSTPVTEYSNVFSAFVTEIFNLNQAYSNVVNAVNNSYSTPSGICTTGNQFTTDDIYLDGTNPPNTGRQLYFQDTNGDFHTATLANLRDFPTSGPLDTTLGLRWIRFVPHSNDVWDINPTTGVLTGISSVYTCS